MTFRSSTPPPLSLGEVLPRRDSTIGDISDQMRGPTETSNWVIKDALMAGAQPDIVEDVSWNGKIRRRTDNDMKTEMNLIECAVVGGIANRGKQQDSSLCDDEKQVSDTYQIEDYQSARWLNHELAAGQLNWDELEDPAFVVRAGDRISWNVVVAEKEEEKDIIVMTVFINRPGDLKRILGAGIDVFVCLQSELSSRPLPYEEAANEWYKENHDASQQRATSKHDNNIDEERCEVLSIRPPLEFYHFPTRDGTTFEDEDLIRMVDVISKMIRAGRRIYVHCRGGHGRTGVLVACLLGALFPRIGEKEVLERVQKYHDCRIRPQGELVTTPPSPQTKEQVAQVKRYLRRRRSGFFSLFCCCSLE